MKKLLAFIVSLIPAFCTIPKLSVCAVGTDLNGWLMWHSYTDYFALDSRLFVRNPGGETVEITGDFYHAMNGDFGNSPDDIVFMAIDSGIDEWDIYLSKSGIITNLTKNSGFRNEDPKFSPDGKTIVFKRGIWSSKENDFVYNLALLDSESGEVTILTDDIYEEAMPYFSSDGNYIYYTNYKDSPGEICRLKLDDNSTETIYTEPGVCAYYPMIVDEVLYFAKWYSAENHTDTIIRCNGEEYVEMPFNSPDYNCSDPFPIDSVKLIYSGTQNGSYDLYYFDGEKSRYVDGVNTDIHELGAAFFPCADAFVTGDVNADGLFSIADVVLTQKWLLGVPDTELENWHAGDLCADGILDVYDLCLMKRALKN